jgi:hypothetical protein
MYLTTVNLNVKEKTSLIENGLIESWDDIKEVSWVIFENGNMMDGSDFI